jgi:hypothetical protein
MSVNGEMYDDRATSRADEMRRRLGRPSVLPSSFSLATEPQHTVSLHQPTEPRVYREIAHQAGPVIGQPTTPAQCGSTLR